MSIRSYAGKLRSNISMIFLLLILGWLLIEPLTLCWPILNMVFLYLFSFLVLGGFYVITGHRKIIIVCLSLTALNLFMEVLAVFAVSQGYQVWASLFGAGADLLITLSILWHTAFKRMYTRDDVFAGVIGFLLISACFADIYLILQQLQPGAVHFQKALISAGSSGARLDTPRGFLLTMNDFLYFSFMTITTVGYGDVVPVSYLARRLTSIEACVGVLYIAMFVGRLMGLYMWGLQRDRDADFPARPGN
jgi:voltage-gated potassium channel